MFELNREVLTICCLKLRNNCKIRKSQSARQKQINKQAIGISQTTLVQKWTVD